jgi:hypothetical protein
MHSFQSHGLPFAPTCTEKDSLSRRSKTRYRFAISCLLVGIHEVGDAGTTSGIQAYRLTAKLSGVRRSKTRYRFAIGYASINPPQL